MVWKFKFGLNCFINFAKFSWSEISVSNRKVELELPKLILIGTLEKSHIE
jgi:hypothetical protein